MAKRNSADVPFFIVNGRNVLGALTQFDDKAEAAIEDVTVLGDAWRQQMYAGVRSAELSQEGFYDDEASGIHAALTTGLGATAARILCYGLEGTATGARFVGWEDAQQINYQRQVSRGALHRALATYRTNGAVDEGRILRTWKTITATGAATGTPVDNTVSSSGGVGYLQYDATGTAEAQIAILHSSDNITYAQLFAFACSTGPQGGDRQVTTAMIERYTAVDYTTGGVSGGASFIFFVGLARGITSA